LTKFEKESSKINETLDALRESIVEVSLSGRKREDEVKGIQTDLETIKDMLPKVRFWPLLSATNRTIYVI
jgi:hypothetical protein